MTPGLRKMEEKDVNGVTELLKVKRAYLRTEGGVPVCMIFDLRQHTRHALNTLLSDSLCAILWPCAGALAGIPRAV